MNTTQEEKITITIAKIVLKYHSEELQDMTILGVIDIYGKELTDDERIKYLKKLHPSIAMAFTQGFKNGMKYAAHLIKHEHESGKNINIYDKEI